MAPTHTIVNTKMAVVPLYSHALIAKLTKCFVWGRLPTDLRAWRNWHTRASQKRIFGGSNPLVRTILGGITDHITKYYF